MIELPKVDGGWRTVLLDPPWAYSQDLGRKKTRGGAVKHYPTMKVGEIQALPVPEILAEDAQVWLWSTNSHLPDAFDILKAWKLRYITTATWVKKKIGLGYWIRGRTEHCLLAVKGNPREKFNGPHGATGTSWSTFIYEEDEGPVLYADITKHSRKPYQSYELIEATGSEPRLELFARPPARDGWAVWGNEV